MKRADIIGFGRSGIAAAKLLQKEGWQVKLSDRNDNDNLRSSQTKLAAENITVELGHTYTLNSDALPQLIIVSPGVPWDLPVLIQAREQNIETIGELELAWRYLSSTPWTAITGTNGKTTTTSLIAAIYQTAGLNAPACGNIGYAACELALKQEKFDGIVAEISSYQIESSSKLSPRIGLWTTFTPDHLARHKTLDNYYAIKASLLHRSHYQIFNGDDPYLRNIGSSQWDKAYWTSIYGKQGLLCTPAKGVYIEDAWIVAFEELIMPVSLFKMMGAHNLQNLLMAVGAARLAGIKKKAIIEAMTAFSGVPHRLEYIGTFNGVAYINDSKATNYDAAEVGLSSVEAPVILIAGGEAKEGDDRGWIQQIHAKAAKVLLIGDAAEVFAQRLQASNYQNYEIVETMEKAVSRAAKLARPLKTKVVLLSPACASFDQYQSFEHRGEDFRQLCLNLE